MKIRKDDTVIVIAGKDKGKTGKVLSAFPKESKVIVSGINTMKRHRKANRSGGKGQTVEVTLPIHVSNVSILDPQAKKATRVGRKVVGEKIVRVAKKSGTTL
ncbi:MAG: ribosomal protein large subunit ribosomal protein [Candidatus Parcubacteria bacterium]|jgi:large subunit ribosomal protein L24